MLTTKVSSLYSLVGLLHFHCESEMEYRTEAGLHSVISQANIRVLNCASTQARDSRPPRFARNQLPAIQSRHWHRSQDDSVGWPIVVYSALKGSPALRSFGFSRAIELRIRSVARSVILLIPVLCLTACATNRKEIAFLTPTNGDLIWDSMHTGAVLKAAACGLKVHYDAPPRADDLRTQLELFKKFSESHYATIVVVPIQARAMRDPIGRAASGGQPIVVIGTDLGIRNPNIAYVLNDEEVGGRLAAEKVGDVLHGKGTVAVMGVDLSAASILTREHAFEQELATRFPGIRVVQRTHGSINLFEEQQSAEELLAGDDHLDAIVALTSFATRGAFYAVDARRPKHRVHIIGFDQDLTVPIGNGQIDGVVAQRANDIGKLGSQLACDHLEGKPWGQPHLVTPFLITPVNVNSAEVWSQMNRAWWKSDDENN